MPGPGGVKPPFWRPPGSPPMHPLDVAMSRQLARIPHAQPPQVRRNQPSTTTVIPAASTATGTAAVVSAAPARSNNEVLDAQIGTTSITMGHTPIDPNELQLEADGVRLANLPGGGYAGTYISAVSGNVATLSSALATGVGGVQTLRAWYNYNV